MPPSLRTVGSKCGSCHKGGTTILSELRSGVEIQCVTVCVPRGCSRESPCSSLLCPPRVSGRMEEMGEPGRHQNGPLRPRRGPKGIRLRGGTNLGRYAQMFLQPPKPNLDLKDAYFHIGIHPADRRYLRFCHNGTVWQFTVLPFGLSTSARYLSKYSNLY